MEKTLVIIDKPHGNSSRVVVQNLVKEECVFSSMVYHKDVAYLLEDFGLLSQRKETKLMMQSTHPAFIQLKNLGYRIEEVTL